ncbi:hypothetical protein CHUUTOTORO_01830 [Serratia phage vB_SmaM-ChuuTotoro]|nr:hypothetical protein CHUUTOTORO_01830 [Serratia phage vB_SmaM-ChuuTotoro]
MLSLADVHPKIDIVAETVAHLSEKAKERQASPFYKFRAYEIRQLIAAGEFRHAVNVLADSCKTGTYAAACVWSVAGAMLERGSLEGFYPFQKEIVSYLKERRILTKYAVGEENAITFMKGQTDNAAVSARATVNRVQLKPMIAAYRAACAVSLSQTNGNAAHRADLVEKLIDKVLTI